MPLLSVIIPTHNRAAYAEVAVRKVCAVVPEAEVIVSDTSAEATLGDRLSDLIAGGRVRYVQPGEALDVVSHFEFALGHAQGRYLMFLGDDDCVGPGLADIARWASANEVDAVLSYGTSFIANYFWPGVTSRYYKDGYAARLFVRDFSGRADPVSGVRELRSILRDFGRGLGNMPRAYHGLVSSDLVDAIREKYGSLFGGVSPDIYSASLISIEAKRPWRVDYPFCLPGGSPPSTAGTGAARSDTPDLWSNPHIKPFKNLQWDPLIPEFYAPYIVWAYSLAKAVDTLGLPGMEPNYPRLYACTLLYGRGYGSALRDSFQRYTEQVGLTRGLLTTAYEVVRELWYQCKRFSKRLLRPSAGGGALVVSDLPDIGAAYDALVAEVSRRQGLRLPTLPSGDSLQSQKTRLVS